jgi:hypothetical protein
VEYSNIQMSPDALHSVAFRWLDAFNEHDMNKLLSLYDDEARHYSPKLKIARPETHGYISGKAALHQWWENAFERLPGLRYQVTSLTAGSGRVFMEYIRSANGEDNMLIAEVLEVNNGLIVASRVYHG